MNEKEKIEEERDCAECEYCAGDGGGYEDSEVCCYFGEAGCVYNESVYQEE
jgi:hypothetical protein